MVTEVFISFGNTLVEIQYLNESRGAQPMVGEGGQYPWQRGGG